MTDHHPQQRDRRDDREVRDATRAALARLRTAAPPTGELQSAPNVVSLDARRRSRGLLVAAAGLVVVAGVGALVVRGEREPAATGTATVAETSAISTPPPTAVAFADPMMAPGAPTTTMVMMGGVTTGLPDFPVDDSTPRTATAVMTHEFLTGGSGHVELLTLSGDDVSSRICQSAATSASCTENRRVDGQLYVLVPESPGAQPMRWTTDPDDYTTLSGHSTGHTPFELYGDLAEATGFDVVESDDLAYINGIAVTRLRATDPQAIPAGSAPLDGSSGTFAAVDIWVSDDGIVRRVEAEIEGTAVSSVFSIEFNDVGDPKISVTAPANAAVVDASG